MGLRSRKALVLGATSGLGLASARALAAEGTELILVARNKANLDRTASQLRMAYPAKVSTACIDVTVRQDVEQLAKTLRNDGLDILILNTPRPPSPMREFLEETDDQRWDTAYTNQLDSALYLLRLLAPVIRDTSSQGRIIGITSASVKQPMARHAISTVFRAGVQAALKHLSLELAATGVTVNSIAPAGVSTPTFALYHDAAARAAAMPVKRLGTLEEFGATIAFFASCHSGFITGQFIQFDGGLTASMT